MQTYKQELAALLTHPGYQIKMKKAGVFRFPSNYRFETHDHLEYEMNYVNNGACMMEVNGSYVSLKAGDCIVIAPHSSHCFMVDMRKTCRITQLELVIQCPQSCLESLLFPNMEGPYYKLQECEQLLPLLERISYYVRAGRQEPLGDLHIDLTLMQLYLSLSELIGQDRKNRPSCRQDHMTAIIRHIHENLESELNMEQVASRHGVSSRCVRKYFEKQIGMGSSEYITMLRIGKAKRLLWSPKYSITEIALMCGFSSSQYFSSVFRRHTGIAPAAYRRHEWTEGKNDGGIT